MTPNPSPPRIGSMDQFRGFTVEGMILVNFLDDFGWISENYPVLKHHNTYFSYADTIMPSFHFAVGFALRLVLLKRIAAIGVN
jgi:predicted acyltransferase